MKRIKNFQLFLSFALAVFSYVQPIAAQSQDATLGESISPFDRGATEQQIQEQNERDLALMKEFYKGDGSEDDCYRLRSVDGAGCSLLRSAEVRPPLVRRPSYTCNDLKRDLNLADDIPYYEYYVPFQKLEHVEVPYTTAYLDKQTVEGFLKQSEESLYQNGVDGARQSTQRLVDTLSEMGFEGDQSKLVDELAKERERILSENSNLVKEFSLKDSRFRSSFRGDGRYMETHVLPTEFDIVYREEYKNSWVHQGAINSWIKEKPPVPIWFSEFPESILAMRYPEIARQFEEIGREMNDPTGPDNCITEKFAITRLDESLIPDQIKGTDNCMEPAIYGTKFPTPFNFDKGTIYATQAATKRDWMGLKLALALSEEYGAYQEGAFHQLQDETGTDDMGRRDHKKDLIQFLDDRRQTAKNGQARGCFVANEDTFLPDINWTREADANKNTEGERFVTAHYRYVRGCPVCYAPTPGSPEPILK